MNSVRTDDSGSPVSASLHLEGTRDVSELVSHMEHVVRLLQEQKVCFVCSIACACVFLEYNHVYSSIWSLVFGNRCSFIILLQLRLVAADFMDIIWSFIFLRSSVSA